MNRNVIEILIGFLVIAIAVGFLIYTYKVADVKKLGSCYEVKAKFDQVEGVIVGSDAMISGIKVGTVTGLTLDPQTYSAIMIIGIGDGVKLPVDSSARIVSSGLLGGKYVDLQPGADDQMLKNAFFHSSKRKEIHHVEENYRSTGRDHHHSDRCAARKYHDEAGGPDREGLDHKP
jgi:phospholipid/cholesterol/gamma-HCH transport system substrate-binding protein